MTMAELMAEIIAKQDELEILRVKQLANIHARNYYNSHDEEQRLLSEYFEINKRVKVVITELVDIKQQLETAVVAEIKATPMPSGWICPRCQKVHSWMIQSCDCYPSVITASTTEPIKELAEISGMASCNSCRHQDTCNIDSDNVCKWEPKTE